LELAFLTNIVAQSVRVMKEFQPHQIIVRDDLVYPDGALVVVGYDGDGTLLVHPPGGGVQYRIPSSELSRFGVVSEEEKVRIFTKATFSIEGLDDQSFGGWSDGSRWNGWEKPLFEFKDALSALNALGATSVSLGDKNVLRANLDSGNGIEDVEWEAAIPVFVSLAGIHVAIQKIYSPQHDICHGCFLFDSSIMYPLFHRWHSPEA
jgi:hypothetical protein